MARRLCKLDGSGRFIRKVEQLIKKSKKEDDVGVIVGYEAPYAVFVHEDLMAVHINGQAKYLEQPARTQKAAMLRVMRLTKKRTKSTSKALMAGGLLLQKASQVLVPVASGFLKSSAFTQIR